jgi:hypothetical protein
MLSAKSFTKILRLSRWVCAVVLLVISSPPRAGTESETRERVHRGLEGVRVPFIANAGQTDSAVAYYAPTLAGTVFVTRDGQIVYSLPGARASGRRGADSPGGSGWSLIETVVGGRARPIESGPASTGVSCFIGNDPARWRSSLPTFEGVSLGEVWPGISLELRAHGKNVEKLLTVGAGADASRIGMRVAGASWLRVNREGALVAGTGLGEVTFTPPAAYQERQGMRRPVRVAYELRGREYGFRLADYDSTLPVVIDPLLQATYLGGSLTDFPPASAIHPTTGDVYVAGRTASTNFPGTAGGAQPANAGGEDLFVARLTASLTALTQATYLGGALTDFALALTIHPTTGDVYVAGGTLSTNFPGTAGGAQPANAGGNGDVFVARLTASLTALTQATYLGGSGFEEALALAIHPTTGDVYVAGRTSSTNFPGTAGGAQPANGGDFDGFVAHLTASLTALTQATYLGGSGFEEALALAIHPTTGDVYVAGQTGSTDFPGTAGGAQPAFGGNFDGFVARLTASLTTLTQATYLGGSGDDRSHALAIHPTTGDVYVAGRTDSTDFPGTAGGAQAANGGSDDGFVARLTAALTSLNQATYLGGSNPEDAFALAIHPTTGDAYVAGRTESTDFPATAGGVQPAFGGGFEDAFVARLTASLTALTQATYLGGSGNEEAHVLAIHPTTGDVYVEGNTSSTDFPGTAGGAQPAFGGAQDGFVARLTARLAAAQGCAPGFWKQPRNFRFWCGRYTQNTLVSTVFDATDCSCDFRSLTFLQALSGSSGPTICDAQAKLYQQAVSALLNACSVSYPLSRAQIISEVNTALQSCNRSTILFQARRLNGSNNLGCPLGGP